MNHRVLSFVRFLVVASLATVALAAATSPAPWDTPPGWTETRGGAGGKIIDFESEVGGLRP